MSGAVVQYRSQYDSLDIVKFLLSIVIVSIHVNPFGDLGFIRWPIARAAVPLFFLIGGFLFFKKIGTIKGNLEEVNVRERHAVVHFVKRNLQLYCFWLVVFFPYLLVSREWLSNGPVKGTLGFFQSLFLGDTFIASWYIMASVIATILVWLLSKRFSSCVLLIVFSIIYIWCCLVSNYSPVIEGLPLLEHGKYLWMRLLGAPYNNFFVALIWVLLAKIIADSYLNKDAYNSFALRASKHCLLIVAAISFTLLLCEQIIIYSFGDPSANDCYLMLPFFCVPIFILVLRWNVRCKYARLFRASSTLTYCLHGTLASMLSKTALVEVFLLAPP